MKKKIVSFLLMLTLISLSFITLGPEDDASAATDITKQFTESQAKKVVAKALNTLKETSGICYELVSITNYSKAENKPTAYRYINGFSTNKLDYYMAFDRKENEKAWFGYNINGKVFRKGFSDIVYTVYDNSSNSNPNYNTEKLYLEYMLSNLKNPKVSTLSSKNYVITAKPNWEKPDISNISLTINRKTGRLIKIKCKKAKRTYSYINSSETYTVIGGTYTYSKIGYGDFNLTIPDELEGMY